MSKLGLWIIGTAGEISDEQAEIYQQIGKMLGKDFGKDLHIVIGATGGSPVMIALEARQFGVFVTVVYPFKDEEERAKFDSPCLRPDQVDEMIYWGYVVPAMTLPQRFVARDAYEIYLVQKAEVSAIVFDGNGEAGTLREAMAAWEIGIPYIIFNYHGSAGKIFGEAREKFGSPKGSVFFCRHLEQIIQALQSLLKPAKV